MTETPPSISPPTRAGRAAARRPGMRNVLRVFAVLITLAADILLVAGLFAPWMVLYKISDPDFPARLPYGPWRVLQAGVFNTLWVATALYFLVVAVAIVLSLLMLRARAATAPPLGGLLCALAVLGMVMTLTVLAAAPMNSFVYPYYSTDIVYGGGLAVAGFALMMLLGFARAARSQRA